MIEALTGQGIDVRHACRTLGVSESGFYAWKGRPASPRALRRIWLAGEITHVRKASAGTYGALRVTAELKHGRAIKVGHSAVSLIMRELGIMLNALGMAIRRRAGQDGLVIHSDRGVPFTSCLGVQREGL